MSTSPRRKVIEAIREQITSGRYTAGSRLPTELELADELAVAMECRCYQGGKGRTRMKQMKLHGRDLISGVATAAVFAGVILLNKYVNLLPTIW